MSFELDDILKSDNPKDTDSLFSVLQTIITKFNEDPHSEVGKINEMVIQNVVKKVSDDIALRYTGKGFPVPIILGAVRDTYQLLTQFVVESIEKEEKHTSVEKEHLIEDSLLKILKSLEELKDSIKQQHKKYLMTEIKKVE